jgi:hypothetical protein
MEEIHSETWIFVLVLFPCPFLIHLNILVPMGLFLVSKRDTRSTRGFSRSAARFYIWFMIFD